MDASRVFVVLMHDGIRQKFFDRGIRVIVYGLAFEVVFHAESQGFQIGIIDLVHGVSELLPNRPSELLGGHHRFARGTFVNQLDVGIRDEFFRTSGEHEQSKILHHARFNINKPHMLRHILFGQVLGVFPVGGCVEVFPYIVNVEVIDGGNVRIFFREMVV